MPKRTSGNCMNVGFQALFDLGCRQFAVHTSPRRQIPALPVVYEVSFWVPIQIGGQDGLSVVVRGGEYDDPFKKAVQVARDLLDAYPRANIKEE